MSEIFPETIIQRNENLLSNNLGEDIVMMDIEKGSYYGLEEVAARIWELTENPASISSICQTLTAEYDVSQEQCSEEVMKFVKDLLNQEIIEISK